MNTTIPPHESDAGSQSILVEVTGRYEFGQLAFWMGESPDQEPNDEIDYGPFLKKASISCYSREVDSKEDWKLIQTLDIASSETPRPWMLEGQKGLQRLTTCEVKREGSAVIQAGGVPEIEICGKRLVKWRQNKSNWYLDADPRNGEEWYFAGKLFYGGGADIFDPPRGIRDTEWNRLVWQYELIQRHTSAPSASFVTAAEALTRPEHDDYVEWLAMLPTEHLPDLGLLPETVEWLQEQRNMSLKVR